MSRREAYPKNWQRGIVHWNPDDDQLHVDGPPGLQAFLRGLLRCRPRSLEVIERANLHNGIAKLQAALNNPGVTGLLIGDTEVAAILKLISTVYRGGQAEGETISREEREGE